MYFKVQVEHILNLGIISNFLCGDFFLPLIKQLMQQLYLHKKSLEQRISAGPGQVNPFLLTPNNVQSCKSFEFH